MEHGDSPSLPAFFLATKLLPCGPFDDLKKFTGNNSAGEKPKEDDLLTKAIHAFAHFSLCYTKGHMILCDLQGA